MKKSVGLESTMLAVYTLFWSIPISMSTTYNQCQGTNLNHSGTVCRKGNIKMCSNSHCEVKLLLGKLRILLHGEIGVGEVAVGETSDWGS